MGGGVTGKVYFSKVAPMILWNFFAVGFLISFFLGSAIFPLWLVDIFFSVPPFLPKHAERFIPRKLQRMMGQ